MKTPVPGHVGAFAVSFVVVAFVGCLAVVAFVGCFAAVAFVVYFAAVGLVVYFAVVAVVVYFAVAACVVYFAVVAFVVAAPSRAFVVRLSRDKAVHRCFPRAGGGAYCSGPHTRRVLQRLGCCTGSELAVLAPPAAHTLVQVGSFFASGNCSRGQQGCFQETRNCFVGIERPTACCNQKGCSRSTVQKKEASVATGARFSRFSYSGGVAGAVVAASAEAAAAAAGIAAASDDVASGAAVVAAAVGAAVPVVVIAAVAFGCFAAAVAAVRLGAVRSVGWVAVFAGPGSPPGSSAVDADVSRLCFYAVGMPARRAVFCG